MRFLLKLILAGFLLIGDAEAQVIYMSGLSPAVAPSDTDTMAVCQVPQASGGCGPTNYLLRQPNSSLATYFNNKLLLGNNSWLFQNAEPECSLTDAASIIVNVSACASNAANGVANYNLALTANGHNLTSPIGNPAPGSWITVRIAEGSGPFTTGFTFGSWYNFSNATVTLANKANAVDALSCYVHSTTEGDCAIAPNFLPEPQILSHAISGISGSTTTQTVALNLTSGSTLIVYSGNATGAGLGLSSITGTGVSGCARFSGTGGTNKYNEIWNCTVSSTNSNVTITGTYAGTVTSAILGAIDVSGLAASPDDAISNVVDGATSPISLNGTAVTTQTGEMIFGFFNTTSATTITAGSGYTIIDNNADAAIEYQFLSTFSTPVATISFTGGGSGSMSVAAAKHP